MNRDCSGTRTSSIRCATSSCRRRDLRVFGGIDHADAVGEISAQGESVRATRKPWVSRRVSI
jgi:hypothetical protein